MKTIITSLIFSVMTISMSGQTFCLEIQSLNPTADGSQLHVELFVSGSADFGLGQSNLRFTFDETKVDNPTLVSSPLGFATGYFPPTVSNPLDGEASLNIEQTSGGYTIGASPASVGVISFDILDDTALTDFSWLYNGGSTLTQVFKDDFVQIFATSDDNTCLVPLESVALPIKMKSFTAIPFENRDANLDWITATEINASHFEIERSNDGENFTQIGRVEATGNSNTDQEYKFSDRDVNIERNDVVQYYRIKMVDIDGQFKYSGVRVVNFTRSDIDFTINAFPNPTTDFVQLELTGLDNSSTERPSLMIFTNTGELVRSVQLNSDLGKIDMSDLPGSLYHFMIEYKGQKYNEKIVVVK